MLRTDLQKNFPRQFPKGTWEMGSTAERRERLDWEEGLLKQEGAVWSLRGVAQLPADPEEKACRPAPFCWSLEREANWGWVPCPPGAEGSCPAWDQGCVQGSRSTNWSAAVCLWQSLPSRHPLALSTREGQREGPSAAHSPEISLSLSDAVHGGPCVQETPRERAGRE